MESTEAKTPHVHLSLTDREETLIRHIVFKEPRSHLDRLFQIPLRGVKGALLAVIALGTIFLLGAGIYVGSSAFELQEDTVRFLSSILLFVVLVVHTSRVAARERLIRKLYQALEATKVTS